jgi:hypothetical protein
MSQNGDNGKGDGPAEPQPQVIASILVMPNGTLGLSASKGITGRVEFYLSAVDLLTGWARETVQDDGTATLCFDVIGAAVNGLARHIQNRNRAKILKAPPGMRVPRVKQ